MGRKFYPFREPRDFCEAAGKVAYDKKSAVTAANARYKRDHVRLRIYPCGDHWHLTSQLRGPKFQS